MHNDPRQVLDDILSRWDSWARNYKANQQSPRDPIFRDAKSGRSWDSTEDIIEDEITNSMMEAVDFQVGEMQEPYRAAIYALARNLSTGRSVWLSPRLPTDPIDRATVVAEARNQITKRLMAVGVM